MIGNIIEADKKAFRNMLRLDVNRGEDSTGIAVVEKGNDNIHLFKRVGAPDLLFNAYDQFDHKGIYTGVAGKVFIGHNRAATKGKVTDENAHPFHHNTVVGAHNGTLDSVYQLEKGHSFDVDSEAIFYNLDKFDAEDTIGNIDGAYALTWADIQDNRLYIIRNKERPLSWTRRKDKDVIYWASLPWILEIGLAYANISHEDIHEFSPDTLYHLDMGLVDEGKSREMKWGVKPNVKGYEWPTYSYKGGQGASNFSSTTSTTKTGGGTTSSNVHPFKPASSTNSVPFTKDEELTKDEQAQWAAWVDKDIDFRVQFVKTGVGGAPYLHCYPDNPILPVMNIRVFAANKPIWNDMVKGIHRNVYTGKVKRFVRNIVKGKREYYLAIDLRTIEKAKEKEPVDKEGDTSTTLSSDTDDTRFYEGYQGTYLTRKEWERATKDGCAGCFTDADELDEDIHWLDHQTFLCGACCELEVHKSYVGHY